MGSNYLDTEHEVLENLEHQKRLRVRLGAEGRLAGEAKVAYKVAYAGALIRAKLKREHEGIKITEGMAEALATLETEQEFNTMELTAATVRATELALSSLKSSLEGLRSLLASQRETGV